MYPKCGKKIKSINGLRRYFNICIKKILQTTHLYKLYNDKLDILNGDLKDGSQLLDKTNYTVRDVTNLLTKRIPWDKLLVSESLSLLREEWFTRNKFLICTQVSDNKYNHLKLKHQNSFYPFKDQLDYALAYYFAESETTKGNVN